MEPSPVRQATARNPNAIACSLLWSQGLRPSCRNEQTPATIVPPAAAHARIDPSGGGGQSQGRFRKSWTRQRRVDPRHLLAGHSRPSGGCGGTSGGDVGFRSELIRRSLARVLLSIRAIHSPSNKTVFGGTRRDTMGRARSQEPGQLLYSVLNVTRRHTGGMCSSPTSGTCRGQRLLGPLKQHARSDGR